MAKTQRIVLTGGAGFIGSNLLQRLNELGEDNILVVDNLRGTNKYRNLVGRRFLDYLPKLEFLDLVQAERISDIGAVFHQGACTDTMEHDGEYMMRNNYAYSKAILEYCLKRGIPFVYASSGAVYGHSRPDGSAPEAPLNIYGYSKLLFDEHVRRLMPSIASTVVGLRYFNVYGHGEAHKGRMASMAYQFYRQVQCCGVAKLFGPAGGYAAGEQTRDFVYVKDLVEINLFFWQRGPTQTIVDAGTGVDRTWNSLASAVSDASGKGCIDYIDFPEALEGKYQFHTRADVGPLRALGYDRTFHTLDNGIKDYVSTMIESDSRFLPPDRQP